ncbi:MAG: glutamyl-tRNA reductase [Tissierellia bacterium]|nr:glutamyl-tRNA reductase [Tissierellia bacterium]
MEFFVVGINHHICPIEVRERVHFSDSNQIEASNALLSDSIQELVILSTCNRSEIYGMSRQAQEDTALIQAFYKDFFQVDDLADYFFVKTGREALRHLFNVTMGLDSLVIGEDQILGQVTDAHLNAMEIGSSKKILNKIFREAITLAKRTKTETTVSEEPISIAYLGVQLIKNELDLRGKKAAIVGVGQMGQLALDYLLEAGAQISICNRTYANSLRVAQKYDPIDIVPFEDLIDLVKASDVFVSATASPHTILKAGDLGPRKDPLYIMDLSLPRDIDPDIGQLEAVKLYDIDHLQAVSQKNMNHRKDLLLSYDGEVTRLEDEILNWIRATKFDPIMQNMNQRCDEVAAETLDYIFRKTHLSHGEKKKVDAIVHSALKKIAREPLLRLKDMPDQVPGKEAALNILEEVYDL